MKGRKYGINRLFYNNKFALAFSLLASAALWVVMISMDTEDHPRTVMDVPVVITLSDAAQADGLKVFSPTNEKASVSIKGNSLIVNQVKASDMQVVAPLASTIKSPGTYPFTLTVQKKGNLTDYTVVSITPDQYLITVDRYKEKTFNIQSGIVFQQGYKSDPSYFVGAPSLSSDTVTISGPEKQVQQVNRVAYEYEIKDTLTETKQFTTNLVLYDANGNKISDDTLKLSEEKVDVTIPVLPRRVLPLNASFTGKPDGLTLSPSQIEISPQSIEVAGPQDAMSTLNQVTLAPIDFSSVSPTANSFDVDISLPQNCRNLSNLPTAKVTLNLSGMSTRKMNVTSFNVNNLSSDKSATVYTKSMSVTVVGPEPELAKLTDGNIVGEINMSGKENFTGHTEMPVTFHISNATSCWVYGSYMANIGITSSGI